MLTPLSYVLITPARNEAQLIEKTLRSVVTQTARPLKWVIVSDGSTDGTDEIVLKYAAEYPWIELVPLPPRADRNFAAKVFAFRAGMERVAKLSYQAIGNLDADTSFSKDYFSFLLQRLAADATLGLVGGRLVDADSNRDYHYTIEEYVAGPCQLVRRECFESINGYCPMKSGGVDLAAALSARMKGWKVATFKQVVCLHHRAMNGAQMSGLRERLHRGRMDYLLGGHPLWEVIRGIYQMKNRPYLVGGVLILFAYFRCLLLRVERTMPTELIAFRRRDQMERLKVLFLRFASTATLRLRAEKGA